MGASAGTSLDWLRVVAVLLIIAAVLGLAVWLVLR
jgi:hypothetical protein